MSFDALAPIYRKAESILAGGILQQARVTHLPSIASRHRALLLGEGPGRFLVELLSLYPGLDCTCVEKSPGMLTETRKALAQRRLPLSQVRFLEIDALQAQRFGDSFDLIVTHFFLDCFTYLELERLIRAISRSADPDAHWLISDFRIPNRGWQRIRARLIHRLMYGVFKRITEITATQVHPPESLLERAGFRLQSRREFNHGLVHSDLWHRSPPSRTTTWGPGRRNLRWAPGIPDRIRRTEFEQNG